MSKPTLAVIGSGIAGLSAAWLLRNQYQVTLFERHARPGMGAYAVSAGTNQRTGKAVTIDIPLRVITSGYYNELFNLYKTLGVEIERTDHSGAFFTHTGGDIFHYKTYTIGERRFAFLNSPKRLSKHNISQGMAAIKFFAEIKKVDLSNVGNLTFGEFLQQWPHSKANFIDNVLMPMLSTICTCDYDSVKQYPASIIIGYLACGVAKDGVWKATHGVADIVQRITQGYQVEANCDIQNIKIDDTENSPIQVIFNRHQQTEKQSFDHIVIATQPQHAAPLIEAAAPEIVQHFKHIKYAKSSMVVHRDDSIYPRPWQDLSPVCYSINPSLQRPMATVCLNKSMPTVKDCLPIFQTWHPTTTIAADKTLADVTFERPVINFDTLKHIESIKQSMLKANNRVWFCGSYLGEGIPLLEAGVQSALFVANQLGAYKPW